MGSGRSGSGLCSLVFHTAIIYSSIVERIVNKSDTEKWF